ncbi:eukaryotic translation initiation factor 4E-1A-like [Panonychus citri]|uniref:eukaryotic translation initiation factor 4E-1A-like n=1 Tax=Panonychus citri TaxID=50023 RepID=UPI002306F916|nr:eukaryotic translation initiation factor 4E-1A-like [Panonychus citri]
MGEVEEVEKKNPLNLKWTLWYLKPNKGGDWESNLVPVTSVGTVEDFWALYNHIELPSNLIQGSDYSVFKDDIKPMWEDKANRNGGRWLMTFEKGARGATKLDNAWLEVLLCLIGEAFDDESDQVCGAVVNVRRVMTKISVWTANYDDKAANKKIGKIIKQRTGYSDPIYYERHVDTAERGSKNIAPWDSLE